MSSISIRLVLGVACLAFASGSAHAEPPIWESRYGFAQHLSDDSTRETTFGALDFSFRFEGADYSGASPISISSNGFVSIGGSNGSECCAGDPQALTHDAFGRIAVFWADLNPSVAGDVYLNTFDDFGGPEKDRLVITWNTAIYDNGQPILAQIQMKSNGVIILGWNGVSLAGFDDDTLVGIAPGGHADMPGSTDLSAAAPFDSGAQGAIYELFQGAPPPFDLDQTNVIFTPMPRGGYRVTRTLCTPNVWETHYGIPLGLTDDGTIDTTFNAVGITFPFAGHRFAGSDAISISNNGFISIGGSNGDGCCSGSAAGLLAAPFGRIAPLWIDLIPGATDVWVSPIHDDASDGYNRLVITWDETFYDSRLPVTVQAQLRTDGSIVFGYLCADTTGVSDDALVGVSPGGGASDPGPTDFTDRGAFDSGAEPTIYETFASDPPAIDLWGKNLGFTPNGAGGYRVSFDPCEPPIWERRIYTILSLTDDSTYEVPFSAFGFSFPFAGTTYSGSSILSISSNGFVSLGGSNGDGCCDGVPTLLTTDPYPRLAPLWTDLSPSLGGQVTIGQFDDFGGPEIDRLVITWETFFYGTGRRLATQLQMLSNGTIVFGYRCLDGTDEFRYSLAGISPGGGVADPGSTNFAAAMPFSSGSESTIYEWIAGSLADGTSYDLAATNIVFEPNGQGGFHVSRAPSTSGTVNSGVGAIADVLRVNGSAGSPISRAVGVAQNAPITLTLAAPPHGPASSLRYVLWVWAGSSVHPTDVRSGGQLLGTLVDPTPLGAGAPQPIDCLMSQGVPAAVCRNVPVLPSPHFAPFAVTRAAGFPNPIRLSIQGLVRDAGAANSIGYSATNAVVVDVR